VSFLANLRDALACRRQSAARKTARAKYEFLVITPDICFFSSLAYAMPLHGWAVRWATSPEQAKRILKRQPIPLILYDWCSPDEDWTRSTECLKLTPEDPCIILAAREIDEDLWCRAIGHRVYDVVSRKGDLEHLAATLQFAWKWKAKKRPDAEDRRPDDSTINGPIRVTAAD
jgi:DNA-binding NtrC family response regulator